MFKNEISLTQSYIISKQEKKEIAKLLKKTYNGKHVDFIFKNFQNLSFHKISGNKKKILFYDNNPIFFEYDHDVFYPTVYLLNMLPNFMTQKKCYIYDETDTYLANGADLMLKGIINREEIKKNLKFRLNDIFCVEKLSGTITMIGETLVSWSIMNNNAPSGKFLKNIHRIDDALWGLGNKKIPKRINDPELDKLDVKAQKADSSEKEAQDLLSLQLEEIKKLLTLEFIEQINKMNFETEMDSDKLNKILKEETGIEEEENYEYFEKEIFQKMNLIPVIDYLLKEKFEKRNNSEFPSTENNVNDSQQSEKGEDEAAQEEDENSQQNENEENEENEQEEGESETEGDNEKNHTRKYFNSENLEFITEKINKFNAYYEYLEAEIKKLIEEKLNVDKNSAEKDNPHSNNINSNEVNNRESNDKKIKQHKKHHKKEKNSNLNNNNNVNNELIDITMIESSGDPNKKANGEHLIPESELKLLKKELIKTHLNLDLEYEALEILKSKLAKLNEFLVFTLIMIKSKNDSNFMADPKFLSLLTSFKGFFKETDINHKSQGLLEDSSKNTEEKEEHEENEMLNKMTPEEIDENINIIFLTIMKLIAIPKKEEIFPLDPGKLLKDFMKPMAQELGLLFDFRNSTHKKITNYLKHLAKNENLIVFSKPKGMQNDYILSVNIEHEKYKNFVPRIKKVKFITNKANKEDERENVILGKDEKIELTQMFKPNSQIADIFKKIDKEYQSSSFYPINKCNEILTNYLKLNNLFAKGTGEVLINQELKDKIFKKSERKIGDKLKMDEVLQAWRKNLNEKDIVTKISGDNTEVFKTTKGNTTCKIKITAKKLYNKNVTIVDGLNFFVDLKEITKTFSKHFACAVTIKPFQNSENVVFIQGYWAHELVEILQGELKLSKNFIVVEDKLNLKKK